jgi:hypothetical protein
VVGIPPVVENIVRLVSSFLEVYRRGRTSVVQAVAILGLTPRNRGDSVTIGSEKSAGVFLKITRPIFMRHSILILIFVQLWMTSALAENILPKK